jgi:hypothetical protein
VTPLAWPRPATRTAKVANKSGRSSGAASRSALSSSLGRRGGATPDEAHGSGTLWAQGFVLSTTGAGRRAPLGSGIPRAGSRGHSAPGREGARRCRVASQARMLMGSRLAWGPAAVRGWLGALGAGQCCRELIWVTPALRTCVKLLLSLHAGTGSIRKFFVVNGQRTFSQGVRVAGEESVALSSTMERRPKKPAVHLPGAAEPLIGLGSVFHCE